MALQILYRFDTDSLLVPSSDQALAKDIASHFDHFETPEEVREFSALLVAGTLRARAEIDTLLQKEAPHWKLDRMSAVDRNILRMSTYELLNVADVHPSITIDEAVELAKQFGTEDSSSFVNGILDTIRKTHCPDKNPS